MIIVDTALQRREAEGRPIRVGMVGAGAMGTAIAKQITQATPGMTLVAIANRHPDAARRALAQAGVEDVRAVDSVAALQRAAESGAAAVTDDPLLLCRAGAIDAVLEVTGTIEHAAHVVVEAIDNHKHVVLMNAELEATLGPILKVRADRQGVVFSGCDGDQPGVEVNLHRFVRGIGLRPLVCGNIKGLQDRTRNPETQQAFAARWGLTPQMAASFADGTKMSFEQAVVGNATGMRAPRRGLIGREHLGHVDELTSVYSVDELEAWGGIVDYVVGAQPAPGVYVVATHHDPGQRKFMELYKRGPGPLYSFYTPQHLCHFEVPTSVARAVIFGDAATAPLGPPLVHVVATAKRDLRAGETLDGIGWFMTYGQCDSAETAGEAGLLPMGLAEGCRLRRDVSRDVVLTMDDVVLPAGRLADLLWAEQVARFSPAGVA